MVLTFEQFDPLRHDRDAFTCGVDSLDAYLKRQAGQDARRHLAACYILCEQGDRSIIGFYTLSVLSIEPRLLPPTLIARLPRYPLLPAALLGRLAVASLWNGQGMGERLLVDAIRRASNAEIAAAVLVVDAIDDHAARFYAHYGFTRFADAPLRLYLPLGHVRGQFS